ncbi:MAG: UvrD-helicase domain-containing protein [Nitrospinota bacterium]|nr:UvrD-helicase domain-containing protein [Nitrospinota bacterium]
MTAHLEGLTPSQKEAVLHEGSPLLVLAGAGSGKTRVVTRRIARLIGDGLAGREEILALTFTNKAAGEMRERVARLLSGRKEEAGEDKIRPSSNASGPSGGNPRLPWISTFHAGCARILRRDGKAVGLEPNFTIYDGTDSLAAITAVSADLKISRELYPPRAILAAIRRAKNGGLGPEEFQGRDFGLDAKVRQAYPVYQRRLRDSGAADFDDLLFLVVRLLGGHPEILEAYRSRFRHILVDEYQDTNGAQHRLLKLLAGDGRNLCVVGDEDQSIYRWRGAEVEGILHIERAYPGIRVIRLEENFRSSAAILRGAAGVISRNRQRREKTLIPTRETGEKLTLFIAPDESAEAEFVASQIRSPSKPVDGDRRGSGTTAVFFRTHSQTRPFEEAFRRNRIPHRVLAGLRFFDRKEVKDLVSYLKVLANPKADDALLRIINTPARGIGGTTIARLRELAGRDGKSLWEVIAAPKSPFAGAAKNSLAAFHGFMRALVHDAARLPVADLVREVLDKTGYGEFCRQAGRGEVVEEFLRSVEEFHARRLDAQEEAPKLRDYLDETALLSDVDAAGEEDAGIVLLMTLHAAKGLEFDTVFLTGVEDGLLPHAQSLRAGDAEIEEERRLFYVGMTRTKNRLILTRARSRMMNGRTLSNPESIFLSEIPDEVLVRKGDESGPITGVSRHGRGRDGFPPSRRPERTSPERRESAREKIPLWSLASPSPRSPGKWGVGARVVHEQFGPGTIVARNGSGDKLRVSVRFASGAKQLVVKYAPMKETG